MGEGFCLGGVGVMVLMLPEASVAVNVQVKQF
jgi:hypothetical protein